MKKLLAILAIIGLFVFGATSVVYAQDNEGDIDSLTSDTTTVDTVATAESDSIAATGENAEEASTEGEEEVSAKDESLHYVIKKQFIDGGPEFMAFVLITLILGLALVIERIIYLNLASTNNKRLLKKVDDALTTGGIESAKEVCKSTSGPVASIFYQGLDRFDPEDKASIEMVEKSVIAYGGVQMGLLERGLNWISLMISIAPMLGFMGTVIGMISAFDQIQAAGDISPQVVAGGIKVALITTVSGLIVAIILQIFYSYLTSRIDSIVNSMEDASISLVDLLVKYNRK